MRVAIKGNVLRIALSCHAFIAMGFDVFIKRHVILHADFPFMRQKNVKPEKVSLELQVFSTKYSCIYPYNLSP